MTMRAVKRAFERVCWNKAAVSVGGTALSCACSLLLTNLLTAHSTDAQSAVTPFVLRTEIRSSERGSGTHPIETAIEARRSDGTRARVVTVFLPGGHQRAARSIIYRDGRRVQLANAISAKTTWPPLAPREIAAKQADDVQFSNNNCVNRWEVLLSYDLLFGQRVAVVKTAPANVFGTTYWRSPDLDCETLQYRVETIKAGAVAVHTEQRALSLGLEEPDAKFFDEGANYAELRPSELLRRRRTEKGSLGTRNCKSMAR